MSGSYQLTITVVGEDKTQPAVQGLERMGAGGVAMGTMLGGAMLAAGAAVAGLAGSSLSAAAAFQNATATFASVAGGALAEAGLSLQDVADKALQMGAQTQFSAAEAQQAMIELAKGGVPVVDVMGQATDATLNLAAAGEVGLANAASIVAAQLGVWSSEGVTAADVSNTLAQAANASVVGVEELAMGLAAVGGVAKVSGVSFEDLNQTMALLAPGFGSASDAGTSFKTMLLNMQPKSKEAAGVMQELGILTTNYAGIADDLGVTLDGSGASMARLQSAIYDTVVAQSGATAGTKEFDDAMSAFLADFQVNQFYDASGAMKGMDEVAQILQTSMAGLSEEQKTAALSTMFGTDAFRAAAFIAEAGAAGFDAMGASMAAAGTAAEQAAIRNQTFKFAWDSLLGTLETLQIVIGGALLPILTSLLNNAIIPGANAVLMFAQSIISANDPLAAFGVAIEPFMPILAGVAAAILYAVVPGLVAWAAAAWTTVAAQVALLAPVIAVGAAVALLYVAWQNNFLGIQDIVASVWAYIQPVFAQLIDWLGVAIPVAIQASAQLWTGTLQPALMVVGAFIMGTVIPALAQVASWLSTNIPIAVQAAVIGFQMIVATTTSVWATVTSAISTAISTIQSVISAGVSVVQTVIQAGWNTIVLITSATWAAIAAVVGPAIAQIVAVVAPAIATIQAVWSAGWAVVQSVTAAVWPAIQGVIVGAVAAVQGAIQAVISFIQSVWGGAQQAAQAQTASAWTAIQTLITGAMLAIKVAITAGIAVVQTIMKTAWAVVVAAAQNDFGKIPGIIAAGWDKIKSIMAAGVAVITAVAGQMAAAAVSLGKNIVSGIISGVGSMGSALSDKLKSMANSALSSAKSALGIKSPSSVMAAQVGAPIAEGVAKGIQAATPKATAAMADMAGKLVGLVSNASGAFGQLANIGTVSQGAVARFTDSMMTVVAMLDEINVATRGRMMASAMQITGGANKVLETITKGVDGFAKLSTMGAVPRSAMIQFADALMQVITVLDEINVATRGKMMASAMQITAGAEKVVALVGAGAEAFTKLATMGPVSVASVQSFGVALGIAIEEIATIARQYSGAGLAFAQAFAESAGKIMAMVGPAVEGLNKLRTLAAPVQGSFKAFADQMGWLMFRIGETANAISSAAVASAGRFADGAAKVIGILGSGVDGLIKLGKLGDPVPGMFKAFADQMLWLMYRIGEVATAMSSTAISQAGAFAESAGKVIGIIGSAVEAFKKLADFGPVSIIAMDYFANAIANIVFRFTEVARTFDAQAVAAAGVFADGAGKVVGIIGTGVDGFTKLADFQGITQTAINTFQYAIFIAVQAIEHIATVFSVEAVAAAAVFAEGAGKVLGIISNGVAGLKALANLGPVSQAGLDAFAVAVNQLMQRLTAIAVQFSIESVQAAGAFSDAAGKAVGILKNGIEGLLLLNTFTGTSVDAMTRFGDGVRLAVAKMVQLAIEFGTDATAAATAFAVAAGQATDFLKKGVEGFLKLADFKAIPQEAMTLFAQGVVSLVNTIIGLSHILSVETLAAANAFSNAIDTVITVVLSGLKALSDLGTQAAGLSSFTSMLVNTVNQVGDALTHQARPAAHNIGFAISLGIADGIAAGAGAIQNAIFSAVNASLAAARAALGIASPSKVFKDQIGVQMSAGMAEGVLGGMGGVQAAVSQVSSGALSATSGSTTNNNQRSIVFEPGSIVIGGGGGSAYATADAVVTEINRRLGLQGA